TTPGFFSVTSAYLCDLRVTVVTRIFNAEIAEIRRDRREDFKSREDYFSCKAATSTKAQNHLETSLGLPCLLRDVRENSQPPSNFPHRHLSTLPICDST